jgi:hypothetical protein
MMRTMFAVIMVFALAMSASAHSFASYDALYTGDMAATPAAGAFSVQGSFIYLMADKEFDADGESQEWGGDTKATGMWIPVKIGYAVMDGFEIGVTPTFVMNKLEWDTEMREVMEYEGTGLADTWIWAKYGFMPEPMLTGRLGFKVATGEDEPADDELATGSGQMDIDAAVMFGVPAGPGSFDASLGYRYRMARSADGDARDEGDWKPGSEIRYYAAYTYFVSDMMSLRLGADGFFGSDAEYDDGDGFEALEDTGANVMSLNPGFDYMMDSGVSLGVDMYYPLMGTNVDAAWGFGLSVGWGS